MKFLLHLIVTFVLQTIIISNSYANEMNDFYLHPSYSAFKKELKALPDEATKDVHVQNLFFLFTTFVLKEHPNYIEKVIKDYPEYSSLQKKLIANSLYFIGGISNLNKLNLTLDSIDNSLPPINPAYIENITLKFPVQSQTDISYNSMHTDYLWAAFFATGNKIYLTKILEFLSKEDLSIRTLAFEMLNRKYLATAEEKASGKKVNPDYKDILDNIQKLDPKGKKHFKERLMCYQIILWSLEANASYKDISEKIKEIIENNPKLNYYKDIKL